MSIKELKEKNLTDLLALLTEKREAMRKLRFGTAGSGMRNTRELRTLRRDIARILTELNLRDRAAVEKA